MKYMRGESRTVLLIIILGVGTGTACVPVPGSGDVSAENPIGSTTDPGETVLTITRHPAFGWCPYENMLLNATVARGDDGRYVLTGSRAMESSDPLAECTFPESFSLTGCFVSIPMDPVVLTEQDVEELERLMASLPLRDCGGDLEFVCDPCRVTEIIFGNRRETSCCGAATEYDRAFGDVETLLDVIASEE